MEKGGLISIVMVFQQDDSQQTGGGGGGGELPPIHSLKGNPNDVLTTCKAISNGLASGFVY